jgi:hypothetical protein
MMQEETINQARLDTTPNAAPTPTPTPTPTENLVKKDDKQASKASSIKEVVTQDQASQASQSKDDTRNLFVEAFTESHKMSEQDLARWSNEVFDELKNPAKCVMKALASSTLSGLDSLLVVATRVNNHGLVEEIVKRACQEAKKMLPYEPPYDPLYEPDQQVYFKLAELPNFPPVGLEFPNVDRLCCLCSCMPAILATKTGMLFFNELVGKVEELYSFGNTLATMKDIDKPSCLQCTYDADAMLGTTKYVVLECDNTKFVVALRPGQKVDRKAKFDKIRAKYKIVSSIDGLFDETRSKSPKLQASFDGTHLLWVHNKADPNVACFEVINADTLQVTTAHAYYSSASSVWWAGQGALGLRVGLEEAWQSLELPVMTKAPERLVRRNRGTKGCIIGDYVVGIQQHGKKVLVTRLWTKGAFGIFGNYSCETLKSYHRSGYGVTEENYMLCNDVLDIVPYGHESDVFINVKNSRKEPGTFSDRSGSPSESSKAWMLECLFRKVWPTPKPAQVEQVT